MRLAATEVDRTSIAPFAWRPTAIAVAAAGVILVATIERYGYHRDELYFLAASQHLAWGYDDQPPFTPYVIHLETTLFGDAVWAIRIAPTLFALALIVLAALSAREFAGTDHVRGRRAQAIAVAGTAPTLLVLFTGHLFVTATGDIFFWALTLWLVARWLRTEDDRLWPLIGLIAGIGLLNNNLVAMLALALVIAAIAVGPRDLFRRPAVYFGALIALTVWSPNLIWQALHGWPELNMAAHISSWGQRGQLLPFQIEITLLVTPVWVAGWWWLARSADAVRHRMLAWGFVILLGLVLITGGKSYYPAGWYPLLLGAGAVPASDWLGRANRTVRRTVLVLAVAGTGLVSVLIGPPVLPVHTYATIADLNKENGETVGWPELATTVAGAIRSLPANERAGVSLLTQNYGEAGALARFGPALGLPTAYSPHDGYQRFGMPSGDGMTIVVGYQPIDLVPYWSACVAIAQIDNGHDVPNQEQGKPVLLCHDRLQPWALVWSGLLHYS